MYYLDLDDVVFDFSRHMASICPSFNPNVWDLSSDTQQYHDTHIIPIYADMPLKEDVLPVLHMIKGSTTFITARPQEALESTKMRLSSVGLGSVPLMFAQDKYEALRYFGAKSCDIFVDDKPSNVIDGSKICKSFLMDAPHNKGSILRRIHKLVDVLAK